MASLSQGVATMPARTMMGPRIRATAAIVRLKRRGSVSMDRKLRAVKSAVVARPGDS